MTPPSYRLMADVSSNNGLISVPNYSRAGHVVLAVKATQGIGYVNPFHLSQCNLAHDFGLTVVHYHYCEVGNSIEQEIAHFRNTYIRAWRPGDYACFDIEVNGLTTSYADVILRKYYQDTQREPLLYTYQSFFDNQLKGVKIPGNRVWLANYSPVVIRLPRPYILWAKQYTDGTLGPGPHFYSGIGNCDGSEITAGVASALRLRKVRTKRRK